MAQRCQVQLQDDEIEVLDELVKETRSSRNAVIGVAFNFYLQSMHKERIREAHEALKKRRGY